MKNLVNNLEKFMPPPPAKSLKTTAEPARVNAPVNTAPYFTDAESGLQKYEVMMQTCIRRFKCEKPRVNEEIPVLPVITVSLGQFQGVELENLLGLDADTASAYCGNLQMAWLKLSTLAHQMRNERERGKTAGRLGACVLEKIGHIIFRGNIDPLTMREIEQLVNVKTRYLEKSRITEYILTGK